MRCLFGHLKEYVAIRLGWCNVYQPPIFLETVNGSTARWVCKRSGCYSMGEDTFRGTMTIEYGQVVPDHKAWANWENS
jgi:hypothetical protein